MKDGPFGSHEYNFCTIQSGNFSRFYTSTGIWNYLQIYLSRTSDKHRFNYSDWFTTRNKFLTPLRTAQIFNCVLHFDWEYPVRDSYQSIIHDSSHVSWAEFCFRRVCVNEFAGNFNRTPIGGVTIAEKHTLHQSLSWIQLKHIAWTTATYLRFNSIFQTFWNNFCAIKHFYNGVNPILNLKIKLIKCFGWDDVIQRNGIYICVIFNMV